MTTLLGSTVRRVRTSGRNVALTENRGLSWPWAPATIGATVTDQTALGLPAFYRGVMLIARTLGGLPIQVFHEDIAATGKEGPTTKLKTADTRYLWLRPNPEETKQTFWERVFADLVRGNAFIFVQKDDLGRPLYIWHCARRRVRVGRTSSFQKIYEIDNEDPMIDYRDGGEIVHIPNWGEDIIGYDPVNIAAETLALGISAREYAALSVSEGSIPPGIVSTEGKLTVAEADELARLWASQRSGNRKQQWVKFLSNGAKFQQTSVDPDKMQLESLRRLQAREVATLLGLPPHVLSDVERSTSWGTGIEEQNRNLMQFNFQGYLNAVEQAGSDALLVRELTNRYMKFNPNALLRGTTLQRYQAYRLADFLTINEKRALEDMERIDGGDDLLAMTNLLPIDQLGKLD